MMETYFPNFTVNEAIEYLEGLGYQVDFHAAGGYTLIDPEQLGGTVMRDDIDLLRYMQGMDVGSYLAQKEKV